MFIRRFIHIAVLVALVFVLRSPEQVGSFAPDAPTPLVLGFLLLGAYLAGALAGDLGLPRITGYILGGLLFGPAGLGLITAAEIEALGLVDDVAIALIAFSAGAELRLREVRSQGRVIGSILTLEMVTVFVAVAGLILLIRGSFPLTAGRSLADALVIAMVFGSVAIANSPSVAVAVINETRSRGPVTSTILGVTVLKDVAVIVLFAVMISLAQALLLGEGTMDWALGRRLAWEIGGSIALGCLVGWLVSLYLHRWSSQPILFILGVAFLLTHLCAVLHLEILLTSLATGLFVENVSEKEAEPFIRAVQANAVPFYALFFSLAGAGIHLDFLLSLWPIVLLLVGVRAAAIWIGTHAGARVGRASPLVTRYSWTGFVSQAGVTLGMVTIAERSFPAWGEEMKALFVAMVAVHELVGPVLLQKGLEAAGETGARDAGKVGRGPDASVREEPEAAAV